MMGMAEDGGLLLPERIPSVTDHLETWAGLSYTDLAFSIMHPFVDLPAGDLKELIRRSYSVFDTPDVAPVREKDGLHILELFHGPTLAFKDVALQFLGNLFEYILCRSGGRMNILAATSGDTGSAAIHGVRGRERIQIAVMHPRGRTSPVQALQMTTVPDSNVHNLAIEGTFDDCQNIMKAAFGDLEFKARHALGTVNSINWVRLLAQAVYYFYAAFRVMERTGARRVRFAVPTGNFGDIFAGYLACRMGLPVGRLVLATNDNDILARFFTAGDYSLGDVTATLSPSMDIQVASNFERYLYYRVGEDAERLRALMRAFAETGRLTRGQTPDDASGIIAAGRADRSQTLAAIRGMFESAGYAIDPHTAVGVHVAREHLCEAEPMICLATAHPAKFPEAMREALGRDAVRHPTIDALEGLPSKQRVLPASLAAVKAYIEEHMDGPNTGSAS